MDQQDYPGAYPVCPGYELQIQPNMAHKTHTLPHPHHHHQHQHDRNRTRDDQNLGGYHGNMSGITNFTNCIINTKIILLQFLTNFNFSIVKWIGAVDFKFKLNQFF